MKIQRVEAHELTKTVGGTQIRITQTYAWKGDRDGALAGGMVQGMEDCYQHLDVLVAQ